MSAATSLPRYTPAQLEAKRRVDAARARMAAAAQKLAAEKDRQARSAKPTVDPIPLYRLVYDSTRVVKAMTGKQKAKRLLHLVCRMHGVTPGDIFSPRRYRPFIDARHQYIWLLYRFTTWSMPQIGRHVHRDHTTVIHALRRISKLRPHRPSYAYIRPPGTPGRPFSPDEDAKLLSLRAKGLKFIDIAQEMDRSAAALCGRVHVLNGWRAQWRGAA